MATYQATFRFPDGIEHRLSVADDEYLLDAGLAAGLDLPYRCLRGWCLTCAARLVSGQVDQRDARRYYEQDREAGFVLLCTGQPESDVLVATHARADMRRNREQHRLPFPKGDWGDRR